MRRTHNKLVRDKIPEIIEANGEKATARILTESEFFEELIKKLTEEVEEFKLALNLEELADVQEVVHALADVLGGKKELEKTRTEKAEKRGGFSRRIFLEETE